MATNVTERHDFFFRAESNRVDPRTVPARTLSLELPRHTALADALTAALDAGMPKGSHRTGCFEVQTGQGIWQQTDGNRIDLTTPRKAAKVEFTSWEELDSNP